MNTKESLQALFDEFNKTGSTMTLAQDGDETIDLGLQDSYIVTRVKGSDFWLFHKAAGYNNGFQYSHTIRVVSWSQEDTYLLDLVDDQERRFHIELIFPELEPGLGEAWQHWQAYKAANRERFQRIDAQLLEEHLRFAETWISETDE